MRTVSYEDIGEVARMWNFEKGRISKSEAKAAIDKTISNHSKNKKGFLHHLCLAVFEPDSREIIGWCGLDGTKEELGIQIFYMIDKKYRKKGYATQCAKAVIGYAFRTLRIDRIDGSCAADNQASKKVMLKAGMTPVKTSAAESPAFYILKSEYIP